MWPIVETLETGVQPDACRTREHATPATRGGGDEVPCGVGGQAGGGIVADTGWAEARVGSIEQGLASERVAWAEFP